MRCPQIALETKRLRETFFQIQIFPDTKSYKLYQIRKFPDSYAPVIILYRISAK